LNSSIQKIIKTPIKDIPKKIISRLNRQYLGFPEHIVLQTVSACNLSCEHCFITYYGDEIKDGKIKILTYKEFTKLLKPLEQSISKTKYFQFSTFEPLMHKHIFNMMDDVLKINSEVLFPIHTNGQIISKTLIDKLIKYPISEVTISLDGINKNTVESFKTGASFEKIVKAIRLFTQTDLSKNLGTVFVLHKNNYLELLDYIDYVNNLGVKKIYVNNLLSFTNRHQSDYLYSDENNNEINDIFDAAIDKVKKNKQIIYLPKMKPKPMGCTTSEMLHIDINGNVSPCDFLAVSTPFHFLGENKTATPVFFGNINNENPIDIYKSNKYEKFRSMHRKGEIPEQCSHCIDAYGLMCSNRMVYP